MVLFSVGALTAFAAGRLMRIFGEWRLAVFCALAVACGMLLLSVWGGNAAWLAVFFFGLAFGPETPVSAALLTPVTSAGRRPLVFSVRQTGNQIGAIIGSLSLPWLLTLHPRLPFLSVAVLACALAFWCACLSRDPHLAAVRQPVFSGAGSPSLSLSNWRLGSAQLRLLAIAALLFSATQMSLNVFLLTHAVYDWQLSLATAAGWVAWLQVGGLLGRLAWGWLAQRCESASKLLGVIGLLAASTGSMLMLLPLMVGGFLFSVLLFSLGFTASGWNGVLVAEVSRIAGRQEAGALSGRVLGYGYIGLALAPGAYAWISEQGTTGLGFLSLFGLTSVAACALVIARPARSG